MKKVFYFDQDYKKFAEKEEADKEYKQLVYVIQNFPKTSGRYRHAAAILKGKYGDDGDRSEKDFGDPSGLGGKLAK